jgi:hypothetical protein
VEYRAAREAGKSDSAFVGGDDALDDRQAQACTAALGGEEGVKNSILEFLRDPRAVSATLTSSTCARHVALVGL